jgi:hypothetical protein
MGRVLVLVLVLLVAGAAGGYTLGELNEDRPRILGHAAPVPADPSVPTPSTPEMLPDPTNPALAPNVPTRSTHLSTGRHGFGMTLEQPVGWRRNQLGETWTWAVPTNPINTYVLRVSILAGRHESVGVAKDSRLNAYENAEADGNLSDFTVESQTADTFIATYVDDGYLRVAMERIVSFDGGDSAYAVAAVTGRERDREGLTDLVQRTADSMVPD